MGFEDDQQICLPGEISRQNGIWGSVEEAAVISGGAPRTSLGQREDIFSGPSPRRRCDCGSRGWGINLKLSAELVSIISIVHMAKMEDGGHLWGSAKARYCLVGLGSSKRGPQEAVKVELQL